MPVTFKSQATGDLVMTQALAETLLRLLGKSTFDKGIIEVRDMPAALSTLKGLSDDPPPEPTEDEDHPTPEPTAQPAFADEFVSLRKRAWPLIQMIERAQEEDKPVVWGV